MSLLFIGPVVREAINRYGIPIIRGLSTYEKPIFNWAYKGQPRWYAKKAWQYYKASTVATIVKSGLDAVNGPIQPDGGQPSYKQPKTRGNFQRPGGQRQFGRNQRDCKRYRKRRY